MVSPISARGRQNANVEGLHPGGQERGLGKEWPEIPGPIGVPNPVVVGETKLQGLRDHVAANWKEASRQRVESRRTVTEVELLSSEAGWAPAGVDVNEAATEGSLSLVHACDASGLTPPFFPSWHVYNDGSSESSGKCMRDRRYYLSRSRRS